MSDLCMYELEENVWDEFCESDDHIVPHPVDECEDRTRFGSDNLKKPQLQIIGSASNIGDDTRFIQSKEDVSLPTLIKKNTMLDKSPWSDAPDGLFSSCDNGSTKEASSAAQKEIKSSEACLGSSNSDPAGDEFSAEGQMIGEKSVVDNNDTYNFQLGQISATDLNFFNSDSKGKEDSDMLYYEWPDDIGNFEDVDRMFRSCDSTFGLGSLSNEDDLWFPSHSTEGDEDALKLGSRFSCSEGSALNGILDNNQAPKLNGADHSVSDTRKRSPLSGDSLSAKTNILAENSDTGHLRFSNGSDARSVSKEDLILKEQISSHKSKAKHRNHLEGKRKERNLDTSVSFHHNGTLKQFSDAKSALGELSSGSFPSDAKQNKQNPQLDCMNYMQTDGMFMQIDCGQSSGLTSTKESSFASNQLHFMEGVHGQLSEAPAVIQESKEKLYHHQFLQSHYSKNLKCANNGSPVAFYDPAHNQTNQPEYEVEGQNEFEALSIGIPAELDSSNAVESSCMSSAVDDVSLEASSFRQLQQVMEQLDLRTKLCIRDSLYRLARSAVQRHNCANANGDEDTSGAFIAEQSEKGFLDIETDTNPIDRSIAHLLFHRPPDPSTIPAKDVVSIEPHTMVHRSVTSPRVMAKEQVCKEETANGAQQLINGSQ